MTYQEEQNLVKAEIAKFPKEFGLRAFRGKRFMIHDSASFYSQTYGVQLYAFIWDPEASRWEAFCKGTPEELRREVIPL